MLYVLNPDLVEIDLLFCMPMEGWTLGFLFFNASRNPLTTNSEILQYPFVGYGTTTHAFDGIISIVIASANWQNSQQDKNVNNLLRN